MAMRRAGGRLASLLLGGWMLAAAGGGAAQTLPQLRASLDTPATHEHTVIVADYLAKLEHAAGGQLRTRLYPGARHEILNETNKDEVAKDVKDWLDACLAKAKG